MSEDPRRPVANVVARRWQGDRVPTLLFNGYGESVAHMYADKTDEPLFM